MGYSYQTISELPQDDALWKSDTTPDHVDDLRRETGLSTGRLLALTCTIGGLQTVWLTIFSHGSSYLSSLGISEVHTSLIWTTAPICGAIVAPIVGVISDSSRISWGRRRPFMVMGAITVIIAISALAWIEPFTALLCAIHGEPAMAPIIMQYWAVFWITFLNVGIQSTQSGIRSLILDVCPSEQQSLASAWAGRFTGLANILGYLLGSVPLPFMTSNIEAQRFRCLSLFAVTVLTSTIGITMYSTHEDVPEESLEDDRKNVIIRTYRGIVQGVLNMPPKAQTVCRVQFFSAMGWFGFLFYSTSYVSKLYLQETDSDESGHSSTHKASGMRFATTASLLFAAVALSMNFILPRLSRVSSIDLFSEKRSVWARLNSLRQTHVMWALGHLLYALLTFFTFAISSSRGGTAAIAVVGIAWGVTQWAPYALIGEELAGQHSERANVELGGKRFVANQNGAMLGVHTVAVSVPQILAAVASSGIFWLAESVGTHDAVGWVLRCSGVAGAVAAWFAYHL